MQPSNKGSFFPILGQEVPEESKLERMAEKTERAKSALPRSIAAEIIKQQSELLTVPLLLLVLSAILSNTWAASSAVETQLTSSPSNNSDISTFPLPFSGRGDPFAAPLAVKVEKTCLLGVVVLWKRM